MRKVLFAAFNRVSFCFILLSSLAARGQSVPIPKVETPNVAAFDKFGDIPVDLATGVPNISVPIHTLHYGNIDVPITLRYHPSALRLSTHPGWVGTGWDLESGGVITRVVNDLPDEFYGTATVNNNQVANFYPWPIASPPTCGAQVIANNNYWYEAVNLGNYYSSPGLFTDVSADEFSFNVMGHSGKFYYTTLGWYVVSDENITVQVNQTPELTNSGVVSTVSNEYASFNPARFYPSTAITGPTFDADHATYVFTGFTLTMSDGSKYYFGGVDANGNGTGIEFYTTYPTPTSLVQWNTNTWLLTKIVDVDGNEVDFHYSASYPTAEIGFGYMADSWNCQQTSGGFLGSVYGSGWAYTTPVDILRHGGTLFLPLYLDNITCPAETVAFTRQVANCLRFTDLTYEEMDLGGQNVPANYFNLSVLGENVTQGGVTVDPAQNLQWEELQKIAITNGNGQPGKSFQFNYNNSSSQRLALMSLQEMDNAGNNVQNYGFAYNNIGNLPFYDGNYSDHWGFFNNRNISACTNPQGSDQSALSIYSFRNTDPTQVLTGLLTQITYPTGGSTLLTWRAHDYSQVVTSTATVSRGALSTPAAAALAGCCRIQEVQAKLADGTVARDKKYIYARGYSNANPLGTYSSGILDGTPTYTMSLLNRPGFQHNTIESITVTMLNSLGVYSYNSEGSYIGYDQVVEKNADNSYTINYFTSYGPDLNGISHWDVQPLGAQGWIPTDNYYTTSDLSRERGKLVGSFKYNANDVLVQSTVNTYRNDPTRFNNWTPQVIFNGSYSGCAAYDALILATGTQHFNYDYYVNSKTVTTYDQNGNNPVTSTTGYTYNNNNLLTTKVETDSKGSLIFTGYKYPTDMTDATSQAMVAAHILSPVLQTTVTNNGSVESMKQVVYYQPAAGRFKPQSVMGQIGSNAQETRQSFYNYDSQGNLQEMSKPNDIHDVYLWGYFRQYPVAKITGSTLSFVTAIVSQAQIDALTNTSTPTNDAGLRKLLQGLRTGLPGALVTTYTYLPLTGITSETDPKGEISFYTYDNFQRLQMITDNDGNVLKTFNYQYQNP